MGNKEVTGTVDEKDGAVIIKNEAGEEVRYAKESDLLAVKGSKETAEVAAKEAKATAETLNTRLSEATNRLSQAEADKERLTEQIAKGGGTAEELAAARQELATAKTSSEELGNKFLELRRTVITATYGVPKETVNSKNLSELGVYEEALKAVIGEKNLGNFAIGGVGGGANALEGKSPMELAQMAYSQTK